MYTLIIYDRILIFLKFREFWKHRVRFRYLELVYLIYGKKRKIHFFKFNFPLFGDSSLRYMLLSFDRSLNATLIYFIFEYIDIFYIRLNVLG